MADIEIIASQSKPTEGMVTLTDVIYAPHAFSALMGVLGLIFSRSLGGFTVFGVSRSPWSDLQNFCISDKLQS
ncbi:MAG TPA: hypothetical protein VHE58_07555 [Burkholderiales bacterium]|nr:hypothetical protein [Burkholderiales bacterium]